MVVELKRQAVEVLIVQQGLDAIEQCRLAPLQGRADRFCDGAGGEADGKERKNQPDRDVDDHAVEHLGPPSNRIFDAAAATAGGAKERSSLNISVAICPARLRSPIGRQDARPSDRKIWIVTPG